MTSLELTSEINHNLSLLADNEPALKKVANYIKKLLSKKEEEPLEATPELMAILDRTLKEMAEGKIEVLSSNEDLRRHLDAL